MNLDFNDHAASCWCEVSTYSTPMSQTPALSTSVEAEPQYEPVLFFCLTSISSECWSLSPAGNSALHYSAAANHLRGVRKLVLFSAGLNTRNKAGRTPLALAMDLGKKKTSEFLLDSGADINMSGQLHFQLFQPLVHTTCIPASVRLQLLSHG